MVGMVVVVNNCGDSVLRSSVEQWSTMVAHP